ncbi:hypothetical protein LJK87_15545 [Paenibacillus sp. P25]|nr:hypothetical protein LJK87_15545 [Paenibacillus sp. P25]
MRVKRYVVESMPDALQKIRTDLGKDAVILNTKEVRSGGFLGLFSKKKIEVIAATDSAAQAESAAPPKPVLKPAAPASAIATAPARAAARAYAAGREDKLSFPEVPDVLPPETDFRTPAKTASPLPS